MSTYDAPNQQVVREDGSGPADEGEGGSGEPQEVTLEQMGKADLLKEAEARGVEIEDPRRMSKAAIIEAIEEG